MCKRVLCVLGILVLCSTALFAQTETGQITGTVTDPSGAAVTGATVTVRSLDRAFNRTSTTGPSGGYTITNLQPGRYEVSIAAPGFANFARQVQVTVGSRNTIDAPLGVAAAGTTVEVVAAGGVEVNTQDQQLSQVVSGTQITQLPTITRNPYDLVQISGNVNQDPTVNAGTTVRGTGFNINGQRAASTNILLDGGENRDEFTAGVGTSVPLDAVQEFRVINSNFTAEYGRATGGIVNVATRAGTNAFHGSVYEFNRISKLAANSYQNNATGQPRDRFTRNQFGYSVGGPIVPDRAFFFQSTEWIRVRSRLNSQGYVPTPQLLSLSAAPTQDFFNTLGQLRPDVRPGNTLTAADLGIAPPTGVPAGTPLFQLVNFPTAADAGGGPPQNTYFAVGRVDFNITDSTTLYGRYAADHEDWFGGNVSTSPYLGFETGQNIFNQNALISLSHVFSPGFVSQSKVAYNRLNLVQPLGVAGTVPGLFVQANTPFNISTSGAGGQAGSTLPIILPGYIPLFPGSAIPFGGPQNLYQFFQDFAITTGSHQFRIGGQYIHTRDNRTFGAFQTGFETLARSGQLEEALNNLTAGTLRQFQGAVDPRGAFPCFPDPVTGELIATPQCTVALPVSQPRFSRNNRFNDASVYIQDTWKAHPRLTLNLGVRWEYFGPQHNVDPSLDSNFYFGQGATYFEQIRNGRVLLAEDSVIGELWRRDWNNFAPRVGFAWDLFGTGRTSLRGGYGISYERNFGNVTFNVIQNPPNYAVIALTSGFDVPAGSLPITTSNAGPLAGTTPPVQPLPPSSLRAVDPNIDTAYAHLWSMSLEHQVVPNMVLGLEYSGSRGIKQYGLSNVNPIGGGNVYLGDPSELFGATRLNPQYTGINLRTSNGDSYYHGLNVRLQATNVADTGLTLTTNYTWAHAIDNLSTTFSETTNNLNLGYMNPFFPGLDRGNADFDVRHRVVVSALWETPWLRNDRGIAGQILGGWSFAPIFSANTGSPFSVFDCTLAQNNCPRYAPAFGDVALQGPDDPPLSGPNSFDYLVLPPSLTLPDPDPVLAADGFSDFGPYPATMTRRNTFQGPGRWNLDFGLYKNFRLTERVGLQFRGELFNAFNHANLFVVGSTADVSTSFLTSGSPGCPAGGGDCPVVQAKRGGLGLNPGSDTRERRNVQLGVKLTF
ncbi:MAG TPA: carboxypeptidase regulatory-like domain-containing protein [Terriglobales bacterium]|nr:carboxypeptidase regulatory-like domain-containing protein [Terriglobales bacterium]